MLFRIIIALAFSIAVARAETTNPPGPGFGGDGSSLTNLNGSAITSGTVPAARGGAGAVNGALKGNGSGVVSQAACDDLSDAATACSAKTMLATRADLRAASTAIARVFDGSVWRWQAGDQSTKILGAAVTSTSVDSGTGIITKAGHGLTTGNAVVTTTAVDGLALNTLYYVIFIDYSTFRLASSFDNAQAGSALTLTGTTNVTLKRHYDPGQGIYVTPAGAISGANGAWARAYDSAQLSLRFFGADPTGVDYSDEAIANARDVMEKSLGADNLVAVSVTGDGGVYRTHYPVNLTNLKGRSATIRNLRIHCEAQDKACIEYIGSLNTLTDNVVVYGDPSARPHTGVVFGRIDDGGGVPFPVAEQNDIGELKVYGTFTCSAFTNLASEVMHVNHLNVQNDYWASSAAAAIFAGYTDAPKNTCPSGLPPSNYQKIGEGSQSLGAVTIDALDARRSPAYGYTIISISKTNPAVVTISAADAAAAAANFGLANGQTVFLDAVSGSDSAWLATLGYKVFAVANLNIGAGTFELSGVDTSALAGTFTSGILRNNTGAPIHLAQVASFKDSGGYKVAYSDHFYRIDPRGNTDWNWNIKLRGRYETASDYLVKFLGNGVTNIIRNLEIDTDNSAIRSALITTGGITGSGLIELDDLKVKIGHNAQTPTVGLLADPSVIALRGAQIDAPNTAWFNGNVPKIGLRDAECIGWLGNPGMTRTGDICNDGTNLIIHAKNTQGIVFGDASANYYFANSVAFRPQTDNTRNLGGAAQRWKTFYAYDAALAGKLTISTGTLTASTPGLNLTQTWDNAATAFTAANIDITDTASSAFSRLQSWQVGGVDKAYVRKDGWIYASTGYNVTNNAGSYILGASSDAILSRRAAANWRLGAADAASPVAQTLSVQSVVAGTTNTAGVDWTLTGSQGTGTGAGGKIIFKVAPAGLTGSAQNALADALTINADKSVVFASNITIGDAAALIKSSVAMNNGAAAQTGTLTNAPAAGNPTKWIPINDNGTTRYIPAW
ncbi:hypothetical protein LG047_15240 [Methylocystis sp. WRRC1]|uniref:hypothetical protein n=1 Tax=Methylocystis sp. WRRC1 TaxID=1732014 RepID=UPI001D13DDFF|nr:hypothetical protein [Methylocystis sp. WRRC1]MCC3246655.1 hypothetical protein [Methylocystis sp. WRRC1]